MVLAERPSGWQLAGCAVVLAGVLYGSSGGRAAARAAAAAEPEPEPEPYDAKAA